MKIRFLERLSALLLVMLLLSLSVVPALAEGIPAWINNSKATIYSSSGKKGTLSAGTSVTITGTKDGWVKFECKGKVGYAKMKYLTAKESVPGYVKKSAYIYKEANTSSEKYGPVSVGTKLAVVGFNGDYLQVTNGHTVGFIKKSAVSKTKPSKAAIVASKVALVDWDVAKNLVSKGGKAKIYDIQTGVTVKVYRVGGTNHMELEPATAKDSAKLKKMSGGKFSWDSRPVILIAGGKYVAAAINTMPHGSDTVKKNDFEGQFCLHLPGSKTHGTDVPNTNHQDAIKSAWSWAKAGK